MKLVLFKDLQNPDVRPGVLVDNLVVDVLAAVEKSYTPKLTMQGIIDSFDRFRPALENLAGQSTGLPLNELRWRNHSGRSVRQPLGLSNSPFEE